MAKNKFEGRVGPNNNNWTAKEYIRFIASAIALMLVFVALFAVPEMISQKAGG